MFGHALLVFTIVFALAYLADMIVRDIKAARSCIPDKYFFAACFATVIGLSFITR